jgi:protein TonB
LIAIKPAPPLTTAVPMVTEPMTLPPQETTEKKAPRQEENDAPRVNVVIPSSPSVNFSVPTLGAVVAPASLAVAPPLEPMRTVTEIGSLNNTGAGGDRPQPAYPPIAKEMGEQGTVQLLMEGDAEGNILSVEVTASSGFPVLDRATVEFIKRHWRLPAGPQHRRFESSITYRLQF